MIFANAPQPPEPSRARISALYRADEVACIEALVPKTGLTERQRRETDRLARRLARRLVGVVRGARARAGELGRASAPVRSLDA